jgi:hypothetical protein
MQWTPDQLVDRYAARHHGIVTHAEAVRCGLTHRQIRHRLHLRRWIAITRAVYRVTSVPVTWRQVITAAVLAGPPGTVASHLTAAALHGLTDPPATPHVTLPPNASGRLAIARVHWSPLSPADRLTVDGIPTTAVARTLIDCGSIVGVYRLCDLVDTAFCSGVSHPVTIPAAIDRSQHGRGKPGVAALRAAIAAWTPGILPGSPAEMRLLRTLVDSGLDPPERQIEILDAEGRLLGRIDMGWRDLRAGLEYDSDRHHNPRHWAVDESRQLRYAAAGWDVRRVGKHDLLPSSLWLRDFLDALGRRAAAEAA